MTAAPRIEIIPVDTLLARVRAYRAHGYRLVQISATRLAETLEVTYSFDKDGAMENLRLQLSLETPRVPSISPVFWAAFIYENEMHDLFGIQVDGMAVDFQGNFYRTTVKHAFGTLPAPAPKPAKAPPAPVPAPPAAPPTVTPAQPATSRAV